MIYLAIIVYIIILIYSFDIRHLKGGEKHLVVLLSIFICLAGLSYRLGIDTLRYEEKFYYFTFPISFTELFGGKFSMIQENEPLWVLLNRTCYVMFGEFQYMKFIIAAFVNCIVFWFLKKYSPAFYTSVLLYFLLVFANLNYQILRESIAVCFFLIALDRLIDGKHTGKKRYVLYYLWIIPALFSHRFAVLTLLFPLFLSIKFNGRFFAVLLVTILAAPFMGQIVNYISGGSFLNEFLLESMTYYSENDKYGLHSLNIFGYMELFVLTVIPYLIAIRYYKNDVFLSLSLLYLICVILDTASFSIMYRFNNYLVFPMIITMTGAIKNAVYDKNYEFQTVRAFKSHTIAVLCVTIFLGVHMIRFVTSEKFAMYYPYSSVITKEINADREAIYSRIGL